MSSAPPSALASLIGSTTSAAPWHERGTQHNYGASRPRARPARRQYMPCRRPMKPHAQATLRRQRPAAARLRRTISACGESPACSTQRIQESTVRRARHLRRFLAALRLPHTSTSAALPTRRTAITQTSRRGHAWTLLPHRTCASVAGTGGQRRASHCALLLHAHTRKQRCATPFYEQLAPCARFTQAFETLTCRDQRSLRQRH